MACRNAAQSATHCRIRSRYCMTAQRYVTRQGHSITQQPARRAFENMASVGGSYRNLVTPCASRSRASGQFLVLCIATTAPRQLSMTSEQSHAPPTHSISQPSHSKIARSPDTISPSSPGRVGHVRLRRVRRFPGRARPRRPKADPASVVDRRRHCGDTAPLRDMIRRDAPGGTAAGTTVSLLYPRDTS